MAGTHEPVAVLGIGAMGHGMAASALRAGIPTSVWNRSQDAARDLIALEARSPRPRRNAARAVGVVVTMVTDADAVVSLARDEGRSPGLRPGRPRADEHHRRGGIDHVVTMVASSVPT